MVGAVVACGGGHEPQGPAHICTLFEDEFHVGAANKIDLLFIVDSAPSMDDKTALLAAALPDYVNRLVNPDCVNQFGSVVGISNAGRCATGALHHQRARDLHVGILSSSLGAAGGDLCGSDGIGAHQNDRGELLNRVGTDEHSVGDAEPTHFLAWFPSVAQALSQPPPSVPFVMDSTRLVSDVAEMAAGIHATGCPFVSPLESLYRFLVEPDPYDHIEIVDGRASLIGVDATLLRQRHDFLRPDSLLDIVVVTDANDVSIDPKAFDGHAWQFGNSRFPGSPNGAAPRAAIECSNPNDLRCTPCSLLIGDPAFAARCPRGSFLDPSEDALALRFFDMRRRFGVETLFPTSRYVRGLTSAKVPDRTHEHDGAGAYVDGDASANCVNPIFAHDLPTDPGTDLCHLAPGPRTPDLVQFTVIGGVPHQLLQAKPGIDPECATGTAQADCPQKTQLSEGDWKTILGPVPDAHMVASLEPRAGLPSPNAPDDADPMIGREWTTHGGALELACTFPLAAPKQDCTHSDLAVGCDCGTGGDMPVCDTKSGAQSRGKVWPSIRPIDVAHSMANSPSGVQGGLGSMCPIHSAESAPGDPLYAFRPTLSFAVDRLQSDYSALCIPEPLVRDASGHAPCTVLATLPRPGDESVCTAFGLDVPDVGVLRPFRARKEAEWHAQGFADAGVPNPQDLPVCLIPQLAGADLGADGSCAASPKTGWCIASGVCPRAMMFSGSASQDGDLAGTTITVMCSEGC
jgi:hypothetical protein